MPEVPPIAAAVLLELDFLAADVAAFAVKVPETIRAVVSIAIFENLRKFIGTPYKFAG